MAGAGSFPKTATLDTIYQLDYNTIQSTIAGVLSTYYGQGTLSSQVSANPVINDAEWDNLRVDINKCYKHITGSNSAINDVAVDNLILAADANAYKTAADYCETNKATVHSSQLTSSVISTSKTTTWNGSFRLYNRYVWESAEAANYWFNLGGQFVIDVSGNANGSTAPKDVDWADNILNAIPTQTYTRSNWVSGTDINVYEYGNNAKYTENYARIYCQKVSSTRLDIYVIISESDVGDQTGIGPAVDENVDTDVFASITTYSSYDAIVAAGLSVVPIENFDGIVGAFNLNITSNQATPIDLRSLAVSAGWNQSDFVAANISSGVIISSNTTASPAMTVSGSFPNGVKVTNNGFILGMGGAGGNMDNPGNAGGTAISVSSALTIQNNGTIAGGGGGGGAGSTWSWNGINRSTPGSAGSSGLTQSQGGVNGAVINGAPSSDSNADGSYDTPGASQNFGWGGRASSPGGKGGTWGVAGDTGGGVDGAYDGSGYAGGAAGAAVVGNSNVTWEVVGTRLGPIS